MKDSMQALILIGIIIQYIVINTYAMKLEDGLDSDLMLITFYIFNLGMAVGNLEKRKIKFKNKILLMFSHSLVLGVTYLSIIAAKNLEIIYRVPLALGAVALCYILMQIVEDRLNK